MPPRKIWKDEYIENPFGRAAIMEDWPLTFAEQAQKWSDKGWEIHSIIPLGDNYHILLYSEEIYITAV